MSDWSLLSEDGVTDVVERAAQRVAREWAPTFDVKDLEQVAYLAIGEKSKAAWEAYDIGLGVLHNWLYHRLIDHARHENRRTKMNLSYEALLERPQQ